LVNRYHGIIEFLQQQSNCKNPRIESMKIVAATHQGFVRKNNEDRLLARTYADGTGLLAVADGLGGHEAGERAAQMAVSALEGLDVDAVDVDERLVSLVCNMNQDILNEAARDSTFKKMGTTLTAALVRNGTVHWVHVGDSRLYLLRDRILVQITEDQTPLGILVRGGEISKEEARIHPLRNLLMSCLGREECEVDSGILELRAGDLLLLTTDGLHDSIPEEKLVSLLQENDALQAKADALIQAGLAAGGLDNISLVAAEV
jgi:protein phosphatase